MPGDAAAGLAAVRAEVEDACRSLAQATPAALAHCEKALGRATTKLRQGHTAWDCKSGVAAARAERARLQTRIRVAERLLSSAYRYHEGWLRILSTMAGGYSARGTASGLPDVRRISLEG